jgi:hypothetical protein
MTGLEENRVRPTKRCLSDLGLSFPDLTEPLWRISHPLIEHAQGIPERVDTGGAEPVRSLTDRIWFKCKTSNLRGIITRLTSAECDAKGLPSKAAWWSGAAGVRRADGAKDFYKQIEAEDIRQGKGTGGPSTDHLLPQEVDKERLEAETAVLTVRAMRDMVLTLIVRSLHDGRPYTAELSEHKLTAVVRASDASEAYLAITAEGFIHPQIIAIILNSVPGIQESYWQAEPGGVAGITPQPGQIIWSTIIPPQVQMDIIARVDDNIG